MARLLRVTLQSVVTKTAVTVKGSRVVMQLSRRVGAVSALAILLVSLTGCDPAGGAEPDRVSGDVGPRESTTSTVLTPTPTSSSAEADVQASPRVGTVETLATEILARPVPDGKLCGTNCRQLEASTNGLPTPTTDAPTAPTTETRTAPTDATTTTEHSQVGPLDSDGTQP